MTEAVRVNRSVIIALAVVAALLVVVVVVLLLILQQMQAAEAQQAFEDCMARFGYYPDELNADIAGMAEASSSCDR